MVSKQSRFPKITGQHWHRWTGAFSGILFCHSENCLGLESRQTRTLRVTWAEPPTALSPWALISPLPGTKTPVPAWDTGGEWG